jgi:23S rRNA (adenine2030-N6)-methyltransferase
VNYRHAFHAGNFADLVKHASLLAVLSRLTAGPEPLRIVDTHAGAGLYDLEGAEAVRSREAAAGAARLAAGQAPPVIEALRRAVLSRNPSGEVRRYPGSPALILDLLRPQDRFVACELRPDDHARLQAVLAPAGDRAQALQADGFAKLVEAARGRERLFGLIDPPFERADDYLRLAEALKTTLAAKPDACLLAWLPLKDLETFDSFLRRLEPIADAAPLVAETRLRPLTDPLRLNGCALVAINAPDGAEADIEAASVWTAESLGEAGARAKLWRL